MPWLLVADAVLVLHTAVVLFVVGGLAAIIVGNLNGWRWVNRPTFRWLHLAMISVVVLQAWLDELCPLTLLESWLRMRGGEPGYPTAFIPHWLHRLLYWEAPLWVFALAYSAFGALVLLAWWRWPPRRR
jgi:hypothetical protein